MLGLTETTSSASGPLKILIIDDDPLFHGLVGTNAEMLGYIWQSANNLQEAMLALKEAEANKTPFSVVTVDIQFKGEEGSKMPIGKTILRRIKSQYPTIACIVISGTIVSAQEVLDMRDDYGLDYYISKDRFDPDTFDRGIKRALERVNPVGSTEERRRALEKTLQKYQDICATYAYNLALVEEKKAQRGIDASVDLENQITLYREQLAEATIKVQEISAEIARLQAD
jgi:DNA-binding NtrC family response regulator